MKTYMVCTTLGEWKVLTNILPWPLSTYKHEHDKRLYKDSKETKWFES